MRKTFEELAQEKSYNISLNFEDENVTVVDIEDVIKLLELTRLNTIQECANNALADYNIINTSERAELFREDNIEVYVLKESILQLDKNSIEI